jgi:hypothetical protein
MKSCSLHDLLPICSSVLHFIGHELSAHHHLSKSCALVRGRGIVFRHYYRSLPKSAGKDFRDGAVVPFKRLRFTLVYTIALSPVCFLQAERQIVGQEPK